jgi:GTP cyclohydrolase II
MLLDRESNIILSVERAANDLRKGFPVIIDRTLVASPETISPEILQALFAISQPNLILAPNRAKLVSGGKSATTSSLAVDKKNIAEIASLCGLIQHTASISQSRFNKATAGDEAALKLVKIAELIPSAITMTLPAEFMDASLLNVPSQFIEQYADTVSYTITEACRTDIALKGNTDSSIIAYRPKIGGKEHYAITIGKNIGDTPLIRVHSSCYTGDLLNSLECDCHDQLHQAIDVMHKSGGGIILYMLQEGRGIGLINKLRAYALKGRGMDTVDANEALGFDDDERLFLPAVQILKELGISHIKLLTNNPRKATGLEEYGIKVIECVPHIMEKNVHNERYLKTKSDRLGHNMGGNTDTTP